MIAFEKTARRIFDPLAAAHGLKFHSQSGRLRLQPLASGIRLGPPPVGKYVRYEGNGVYLEVSFDSNRSYEIEIWLGQDTPEWRQFPAALFQVLRFTRAQVPEVDQVTTASTSDELREKLQRLFFLVNTYALDFLANEEKVYRAFQEYRERT